MSILKANGAAGDAYVEINFGADYDDIYATLDVLFPASLIASVPDLGYGPDLLDLIQNAGAFVESLMTNPDGADADLSPYDLSLIYGPLVADLWYTPIEIHVFHTTGPSLVHTEVWVNGSSVYTYVGGGSVGSVQIRKARVGLMGAFPDARQIHYIDNVKFGTTRGGSEIFSDDFEGDLSGWTSVVGDASIVGGVSTGTAGIQLSGVRFRAEPGAGPSGSGSAAAHLSEVRFRAARSELAATSARGSGRFGISPGSGLVYEDDTTRQAELDAMVAANAGYVRLDFAWSVIEPSPGSFNFGYLDTVVAEATSRGLVVVAMLGFAPAWANGGQSDDKYPPLDPADYANFADAVASHFGPLGVHIYELWNEPNISTFWKPTPDVDDYAALVQAAYPVIHAADAEAVVLAGVTSPHGGYLDVDCNGIPDSGRNAIGYDALDFLIGMYAAGTGGSFDALSHHPYESGGLSFHPCSAWSQMEATTPSLRSIMAANGDSAKEIWATEYGNQVPAWVDEATQATRLDAAMTAWRGFAWAGPMLVFNLWDAGGDDYGLLRPNFTPRASYSVFQTIAGID